MQLEDFGDFDNFKLAHDDHQREMAEKDATVARIGKTIYSDEKFTVEKETVPYHFKLTSHLHLQSLQYSRSHFAFLILMEK